MDKYFDEPENQLYCLLTAFKEDRRLVTGRRLTDRKLSVGFCILAQPPDNLEFLIASNDTLYIVPGFLPFLFNFHTKYNAKLSKLSLFLPNLSQIASTLKIPCKPISIATFGVFLFVTPTYQITHSPTAAA